MVCCHLQETVLCSASWCRSCCFKQLVCQVTVSFCRQFRISFCFACSNCRRSSCERFLTLTSTFVFSIGSPRTCPGRFTKSLCCDALLVTSMLRKTARDSCFWVLFDRLNTFRTDFGLGLARLLDVLGCISNYLLACLVACSQAADDSSFNSSSPSSVSSSSGVSFIGKLSYCPLPSHPSKPS